MILIKKAEKSHIPRIAALEAETFSLPQSESALLGMLEKDDHILLVAEQSGALVGYVCAYTVCRESDVLTVAVAPSARRGGIGRALCEALIDALGGKSDVIFLEVRESNAPARALYASMGFAETGKRRGYYQDPREDAILYKREI